MTSVVITSKSQVTIPEEIQREMPSLEIGQRLRWEVVGGVITATPVRSASELAGCLETKGRALSPDQEKSAIDQAQRAHYIEKYGKVCRRESWILT